MTMNDNQIDRLFEEFAARGIQESEIEAAVDCLTRENGYVPTDGEVVLFVQEYIRWRITKRMQRNGECVVSVKITPYGRYVSRVVRGLGIDRIWRNWKERG